MLTIWKQDNFITINEYEKFHFDDAQDIHTSSKNHEESDFDLDVDLLTISYELHVSYPRRSGLG